MERYNLFFPLTHCIQVMSQYWFDVSINDEKIIHKENTSPRTFVDVKVVKVYYESNFSYDLFFQVYASKYKSRDKSQPIADGIYKNFVFQSEDFNDTSIIGENAVSGFVDNIPVGPSPSGLNGFINNLPRYPSLLLFNNCICISKFSRWQTGSERVCG